MSYISKWFSETWQIFINELREVFHDSGVMIIFCFAGLVYPPLYNWIYSIGSVDEMPVAVVDLSQGSYSRRYLQKLDATRECELAYSCISLEEAQELMVSGKVHGIVLIPEDFDTRIVHAEQATVSTYADMSTFLYYKALTIGTNLVMLDEVHTIQTERYAASGFTGQDALQLVEPIQYDDTRLYNPNISFTMFFVYMCLFMILQMSHGVSPNQKNGLPFSNCRNLWFSDTLSFPLSQGFWAVIVVHSTRAAASEKSFLFIACFVFVLICLCNISVQR